MKQGSNNAELGKRVRSLAWVLLSAGILAGCTPPTPPKPVEQVNPYTGGKTFPWTAVGTPDAKPLKNGQNFLSDLSYVSASNTWGPIELDRSNGNEKAGDGQTLKIGSRTFPKGLGVHANSEIKYLLGGNCSTFSATVGIDDEVGTKGSVVFQVYGDGKKLYDSGKLTGASGGKAFSVLVNGVKELRLVVTDAGDGIEYDHADWADAKLSCELPRAELVSLDSGPFADRLVFSRIGSLTSPPSNGVHDRATLRITNTGGGPLQITGLPITGPWVLDPKLTLPLEIKSKEFKDVTLLFNAQSLTAQGEKFHGGTLKVLSNDSAAPSQIVQLAGLWQERSEGINEPTLEDIVKGTFGFQTKFAPGSDINTRGQVTPQGDEVIAPYWQRADSTKPVTVQQLAAYHTQGDAATLKWFAKGGSDGPVILTQAGKDAQSVLPHLNGSLAPAQASFSPSAQTFGFRVDSESSDPTLNDQGADRGNGCKDPCGQHVRLFKARDRSGQIMPDTYLLIMDYSGINYDYNDNVYLIGNLKPASILIDVGQGAGAKFTDPQGNVWFSDRDRNNYALFTPNTAKNEPDGGPNTTLDIKKTDNDMLYRSYRGNVGSLTPRAISFNIPLENGPQTLKLHFADLAHTTAGKRVFDVVAEGQKVLTNLDIVKEAGGGNTALVKTMNVAVTGGVLNLTLTASVDYPSLAGIEVVR